MDLGFGHLTVWEVAEYVGGKRVIQSQWATLEIKVKEAAGVEFIITNQNQGRVSATSFEEVSVLSAPVQLLEKA